MKARDFQCVKDAKAAALAKFRNFYRIMGIPAGNAMIAFSGAAPKEKRPQPVRTEGQTGARPAGGE